MYDERPDNTKQKVAAGIVALIVVVLLASGATYYSNNESSEQSSTETARTTPQQSQSSSATTDSLSTTPTPATSATSPYKDGTYSASSTYYVPQGSEDIKVTVTVVGGTVSNSSIETSSSNRESAQFQRQFAGAYKSYVIGKPIESINLDYVAGSSETSQGFNDALNKIKSEARA